MRSCARLFVLVLLLAAVASAQDAAPKGEIFGGYSYVRQTTLQELSPLGLDHLNSNGWMAGAAGYLTDWLGIKGEVNGVYASPSLGFGTISGIPIPPVSIDESLYTYTFGPVVAYRKSAGFQPFAHALFGGATMKTSTGSLLTFVLGSQSTSTNAFAMQFGGGVDVPIGRAFAIRGQADWIQSRFDTVFSNHQNHFKASAGIVIRFGGR